MNRTARLMVMMFMQYFMQGAWGMTLSLVLSAHGMAANIGTASALLGLSTIVSPLFVGMVADRLFASQKIMAILHLVNATVMLFVPHFIGTHNTAMTLSTIFLVGVLYNPTGVLTNSISFKHINGERLFPIIRVFGTVGFIAAGVIIGQMGYSDSTVTWYIASAASAALGLYSFSLPSTPPDAKGRAFKIRDLLCLDALAMFRDRNFSILMLSMFVLMIPKTAFGAYIAVYLQALGFGNAATLIQVGTASEVVFMFLLSFVLLKVGFKAILMMGAACWVVRLLFFAYAAVDANKIFILVGLALHGLCWDFFFTVADIYVARKARPEIRAQAQSVRFIVANGVGAMFASLICGPVFNRTVTLSEAPALPQWEHFWIYSAIVAAIVSGFFLAFFKDDLSRAKGVIRIEAINQ
ncbi:Nucleoside permease NupG [Caballeronia sordidicola]|uniref:Nucleoside permease NupG n=2 Tax=Caballeronia sordidicola TaxID=196367 RepID=A0A242N777_CABSO|nr:Nucleoside permease NupG [Caballeronia sordidicola]